MKSNTRDLLIGFASTVFSICAGIWTFYNYNVTQQTRELETIFSITEKIELVKLKALEIKILDRKEKLSEERKKYKKEKKEEEIVALIYALYARIRSRSTQIKKPMFADKKNWDTAWNELFSFTKNALSSAITTGVLTDNFDIYKRGINEAWDRILKTKNLQSIEKKQNNQSYENLKKEETK